MKKEIRIKFLNGIDHQTAVTEIFNDLLNEFEFIESNEPDFILFGPYGNNIPPKGNYIRIGYFCENITPDLSICEYAFGVPTEQDVNHSKYKRIQWHNLDPETLVKHDWDIEAIYASKTKFCNFFYSNPVPYREAFFRQLSKYKKVDAPGKSMNNIPSVDHQYTGDRWSIKRQFLAPYKFTIAFENYVYPGYQTEKLYDAMQAQSLPIYCGDPYIGQIFNTNSFLNAADYVNFNYSPTVKRLETLAQPNFIDILPSYHKSVKDRVQRKIKAIGRDLKMSIQFNKLDFSGLIEQIIYLDKNPDEYLKYLQQPWFNNNTPPANASLKTRWMEIFNSKGE